MPNDGAVVVVNLNAAMGYEMGAGNPAGTDPTADDFDHLADDILGRQADIANLQEMVWPAANELRGRLVERTGQVWEVNWAHSNYATYFPGLTEGEGPASGYVNASAGNAQLVRIGGGIVSQRPILFEDEGRGRGDDQGAVLPSKARSLGGTEITTGQGVVDVYVTHLARSKDAPDEVRARDVEWIQQHLASRGNPVVLTGDFNQVIDGIQSGIDDKSDKTKAALRAFTERLGYADVARDKGPTSNQKKKKVRIKTGRIDREIEVPLPQARIDFILTRGVPTRDTARFESHESDHWGLVTTIDPAAKLVPGTPGPTTSTPPTTVPGSGPDAAFLGTWYSPAPVDQPSAPSSKYHVELTLRAGPVGAQVGEVSYPELACRGTLTLVSAAPDVVVVREDITENPNGRCLKQGAITFRRTGDTLSYSYLEADNPTRGVTASAALRRR